MSFGVNRDYKTNARRVTTNLAKHAQLTALYIDLGPNREFASRIACEMVLTKKTRNKIWRGEGAAPMRLHPGNVIEVLA
jgi:hypothetical protein